MDQNATLAELLDQVKQHAATIAEWANTLDSMMEGDATAEDIASMEVLEHHLQIAVSELTW